MHCTLVTMGQLFVKIPCSQCTLAPNTNFVIINARCLFSLISSSAHGTKQPVEMCGPCYRYIGTRSNKICTRLQRIRGIAHVNKALALCCTQLHKYLGKATKEHKYMLEKLAGTGKWQHMGKVLSCRDERERKSVCPNLLTVPVRCVRCHGLLAPRARKWTKEDTLGH